MGRTRAIKMLVCRQCGHEQSDDQQGARCPQDNSVLVSARALASRPRDRLLGRVLGGKYALIDVLGAGGFGTVYRGIQEPVGREVAVKVIKDAEKDAGEDHADKGLRARFFREARTIGRLSHSATVALYDYGGTTASCSWCWSMCAVDR